MAMGYCIVKTGRKAGKEKKHSGESIQQSALSSQRALVGAILFTSAKCLSFAP
jgi:hypothetical protein